MSLQHDPPSDLRLFAWTSGRPKTLSINGERRFEENSTGKGYHRIERSYGKDGVLTVSLPKKEAAKARQVKVEEKKSQ